MSSEVVGVVGRQTPTRLAENALEKMAGQRKTFGVGIDWRGRVTVAGPDDFDHNDLVMVCTYATDPDDLAEAIRHETARRGPFKPAWGYGISRAST